jgi:hypothetical protein
MNKVVSKEEKTPEPINYKAKWKESREALVLQLKNHLEQSEHHKAMATKAQGAIEVNDQLFMEEDNIES